MPSASLITVAIGFGLLVNGTRLHPSVYAAMSARSKLDASTCELITSDGILGKDSLQKAIDKVKDNTVPEMKDALDAVLSVELPKVPTTDNLFSVDKLVGEMQKKMGEAKAKLGLLGELTLDQVNVDKINGRLGNLAKAQCEEVRGLKGMLETMAGKYDQEDPIGKAIDHMTESESYKNVMAWTKKGDKLEIAFNLAADKLEELATKVAVIARKNNRKPVKQIKHRFALLIGSASKKLREIKEQTSKEQATDSEANIVASLKKFLPTLETIMEGTMDDLEDIMKTMKGQTDDPETIPKDHVTKLTGALVPLKDALMQSDTALTKLAKATNSMGLKTLDMLDVLSTALNNDCLSTWVLLYALQRVSMFGANQLKLLGSKKYAEFGKVVDQITGIVKPFLNTRPGLVKQQSFHSDQDIDEVLKELEGEEEKEDETMLEEEEPNTSEDNEKRCLQLPKSFFSKILQTKIVQRKAVRKLFDYLEKGKGSSKLVKLILERPS